MKRKYEIKLVVPHDQIQLANDLIAAGYEKAGVSFDGIELIRTEKKSKSKRK
jgi:hypothetical protein